MKTNSNKTLAENKKAYHDYYIEETLEAGIALTGTEIKSIRRGSANLREGYVMIKNGEAYLIGVHIAPFEEGNRANVDPTRTRKLLMHKKEIMKYFGLVKQDGYALVPTKLYLKNGFCKLEVGLAKGKKNYDKRAVSAEKDAKREVDRAMKEKNR
jgi:SsrA-binding protein